MESEWCHNTSARDANGFLVETFDRNACSWCLNGALSKVRTSNYTYNQTTHLIQKSIQETFPDRMAPSPPPLPYSTPMVCFNDNPDTTKEDVLKVLDTAI